jgi:small-conductance mechanosensitive channel
MLLRTGQRLLQELRERGPDPTEATTWNRVREVIMATWSYELAVVNDRPITVGKVVKGLLGLLCGLLLAAFVSRLLGKRILPRLGMNPGAAEALRSLTFYVLSAVFGLLSLELANVPLTALTFLGGAAAIAVGFASQDLVSNFMSGVILLTEQPIRVGDFVEFGGVKGSVERIGTRSTRVRTDTNVEITVPNRKLLGDNVSNLTLSDNQIWSSVKVSVDSGFPVAEIKDCLLTAVQMHPRVVASPEPFILFTDFGDKTLKFEAHFSIAMQHMTDGRRIESELREAIDAAFREAGFIQDAAPRAVSPDGAGRANTPRRVGPVVSQRWAA